jgi:hypothetical protein
MGQAVTELLVYLPIHCRLCVDSLSSVYSARCLLLICVKFLWNRRDSIADLAALKSRQNRFQVQIYEACLSHSLRPSAHMSQNHFFLAYDSASSCYGGGNVIRTRAEIQIGRKNTLEN